VLGAARQFYRFAAAEAVPAAQRGQAISLTLAGGVLAAFSGPSSPAHTRDLATPFGQLCGAGRACPAGGRLGRFLRLPAPPRPAAGRAPRRLREIARQGASGWRWRRRGGLWGDGPADDRHAAGHVVRRHDFGATAAVIQWHLVAMFAPSFVTGR
jgi:hypothetical protein